MSFSLLISKEDSSSSYAGVDFSDTHFLLSWSSTSDGGEYSTGEEGEITFVADSKVTWKLTKDAMAADAVSQISRRPIASEPMSIIFNLGMSTSFGTPEWDLIDLPSTMRVDWGKS